VLHSATSAHNNQPACISLTARRILTAVLQSGWKKLAGRPHTSWLTTMKNNRSSHNLIVKDATELALHWPVRRLLAASRATHWNGASCTM